MKRAQYLCSIVLGGVVFTGPASAAPVTLCAADEQVVFSCQVGAKVLSLCANGALSQASGRMQYRFGREGRVPELSYPAQPTNASSAFEVTTGNERDAGAHWAFWTVVFDVADIRYQVYWREGDERTVPSLAQVDVLPKYGGSTSLHCKRGSVSPDGGTTLELLRPIATTLP